MNLPQPFVDRQGRNVVARLAERGHNLVRRLPRSAQRAAKNRVESNRAQMRSASRRRCPSSFAEARFVGKALKTSLIVEVALAVTHEDDASVGIEYGIHRLYAPTALGCSASLAAKLPMENTRAYRPPAAINSS